jgi:predicted ester cyclase
MHKGTTNSIQETIRRVRQAFETIDTVDLSNVNKLTSPYYVNLASQGFSYSYRSKIRSPDGSLDAVRSLRSTFTGLHYDVQEIIAANDKVASIISASGKHKGNFFFIPPTGRSISYDVIRVYRIVDGKRVEHKAIRDDLSFIMQLGLAGPALLRQTSMLGHNIL